MPGCCSNRTIDISLGSEFRDLQAYDLFAKGIHSSHDPAPRSTVVGILEEAYNPLAGSAVEAQKLALLFIVFALGALHNLELPANDPSAEEYLSLSQACLAMGDFMRFTTIAGVQALVSSHVISKADPSR
jgi:hypothetical protein